MQERPAVRGPLTTWLALPWRRPTPGPGTTTTTTTAPRGSQLELAHAQRHQARGAAAETGGTIQLRGGVRLGGRIRKKEGG